MKNKLFLDSANLSEIRRICDTTAISGVTTNPSLMAKEEKGDYYDRIVQIGCALAVPESTWSPHLSVELIGPRKNMADEASRIRQMFSDEDIDVDLYFKVPVTLDNLSLITQLEVKRDLRVNATACMIHSQAKLAIDAGASAVSFFYRRMCDASLGVKEIEKANEYTISMGYYDNQKIDIICGSIRLPEDVYACWEAGADIVTAPMKIIELLSKHHKTDEAISNFEKDIAEWQK